MKIQFKFLKLVNTANVFQLNLNKPVHEYINFSVQIPERFKMYPFVYEYFRYFLVSCDPF